MRGAMAKSGLIAPLAELVSEAVIRKRSFQIIYQKGHIAARRSIDYLLQGWQDRQD